MELDEYEQFQSGFHLHFEIAVNGHLHVPLLVLLAIQILGLSPSTLAHRSRTLRKPRIFHSRV